jgi:hypothetical protein
MDTGFLSVQFGSVDYSDPRVVMALTGRGLKERATFGGQIVTALKMVMRPVQWLVAFFCHWFLWTVLTPVRLVRLAIRIAKAIRTMAREAARCVKDIAMDTWAGVRAVTNRRMLGLSVILCVVLAWAGGLAGLFLWMVIVVGYFLCFIPTDIRMYLKFKRKILATWKGELVAPSTEDLPLRSEEVMNVKSHRKFACKIATRAISKVGLLSPTRANKLVYQKVCLDIMESLNVRYVDRVRVLPYAIAACLCRPEDVQDDERCVEHLLQTLPNL